VVLRIAGGKRNTIETDVGSLWKVHAG